MGWLPGVLVQRGDLNLLYVLQRVFGKLMPIRFIGIGAFSLIIDVFGVVGEVMGVLLSFLRPHLTGAAHAVAALASACHF